MTRGLAACAALVSALVGAASASAAAPNYIMVSGRLLAHSILLSDWNENLRLLIEVASAPKAHGTAVKGLRTRPRLDLAEFWNWSYLPRPKQPSQANQHGTFYPVHAGRPPIIVITADGSNVPRLVPGAVLKIFQKHGVPTRL